MISNQLLTPSASDDQVEKEVSWESLGFPLVAADTSLFFLHENPASVLESSGLEASSPTTE